MVCLYLAASNEIYAIQASRPNIPTNKVWTGGSPLIFGGWLDGDLVTGVVAYRSNSPNALVAHRAHLKLW